MRPLIRVAVVTFDGIRPFHLAVPCAVFGESAGAQPLFDLRVCAIEPGPLRTQAGFTIVAAHGLRELERAQIVVVPSWRDAHEVPPAPLLAALQRAHRRGAIVAGLCLGASAPHWRRTRCRQQSMPAAVPADVSTSPASTYSTPGST